MAHPIAVVVLASSVHWGTGWKWTGNFTTLDLIAAGTNALNGALLARRPDHYKNFTVVGVILMALLMGLGGGMTRDVLINQVPGALTNPAYITVTLAAGFIGYRLAYTSGQLFREGLFQFMTSFSLPLYAIVGAQKGVAVGLPVAGVLVLAVVGPTAGRWYVDVSCGVPPKQFIRGSWGYKRIQGELLKLVLLGQGERREIMAHVLMVDRRPSRQLAGPFEGPAGQGRPWTVIL